MRRNGKVRKMPWGGQHTIPANADAWRVIGIGGSRPILPDPHILLHGMTLWEGMMQRIEVYFDRIANTGKSKDDFLKREKFYSEIEDVVLECSTKLPQHLSSLAQLVGHRARRMLQEKPLRKDKRKLAARICNMCKVPGLHSATSKFLTQTLKRAGRA